ncbi:MULTISPECIES: histidine kinase [Paraburkholderia]|uniref:hypothetical protein n=1 Tax=Paraburkholderia TaxID=1822464 RepID=UPI0038BA7528
MTLAVSNEGAPVLEQALATLFDPVTRARTPNRSGTAAGIGLGLYICRCIACAHQGIISVTSPKAEPPSPCACGIAGMVPIRSDYRR